MKVGLHIFTIVLIGALLIMGTSLHRELLDLREDVQQVDQRLQSSQAETDRTAHTPADHASAQFTTLRRVIRDELQALEAGWEFPANEFPRSRRTGALATAPSANAQRLPAPIEAEETELQHRLVHEEIDLYIGRGAISNSEMAVLQSEIARLAPPDRIDAMRRLVAAINAGELDGRL